MKNDYTLKLPAISSLPLSNGNSETLKNKDSNFGLIIPIILLAVLIAIPITFSLAQPVYLEGSLIKATPYSYPGLTSTLRNQLNAVKNANPTTAQEAGFWQRSNEQLTWFRANYNIGHGGNYFENEKASYPYAMYHLMYGMAYNETTIINSARNHLQANDPHQSGHTFGVDLYPSFTLKGQLPKYFYFGKNSGILTPEYMTKMYDASALWSEIDPLYRPSQYFNGPCEGWDAGCRNSWVDIRNTDNLKAMRESAVYLLADETGNTAVRDIYFERIKNHAATLFHKGYSEWDSENYISHSVAPWINLYTYTTNVEMKKISKAAIDWYMMAGAAKYYNGMFSGPSKRINANANAPISIDGTSLYHVYFGDHETPAGVVAHDRDTYISMLSTYRPPQAVYQLAAKQFTPYVEQINTKPQYATFSPVGGSNPDAWETMFYGSHYQMGSVVTASGVSDMRAFKLGASSSTNGAEVFYAYSTVADDAFVNVKNSGDQLSQYRDKVIFLRSGGSKFGFQVPTNVPIQVEDGIWFFKYEKTWIAVRPINILFPTGTAMTGVYANHTRYVSQPTGSAAYSGFAMEVGDEGQSNYNAFKTAVKAKTLDLSELSSGTVKLNGRDGSFLKATYNTANDRPIVYRNSEDAYDFLSDLNFSVYKSVTPPLANLTTASASAATVNLSFTASDPERGLISQDYQKGTLRVITNDHVFTTTVTVGGTVTYSEVPATASNRQGALKAVEIYAGTLKVGEVTNSTQLASGNMNFAWSNAINGTHQIRVKAIDEEGNTTWSNARTVTVTGGTGLPQTQTFTPVADAYVKDGSDAGANFGSDLYLQTKANSGARREAYLKFDLSQATGPVTQGKLRVYGRLINTNTPSVATAVYPSANTSWTESGITFDNRPTRSTTALSTTNVSGITWTWYEWDVASYLEAERAAGRTTVTLVLASTVTSDPYGWFESKENTNKPQLVVTFTPSDGGGEGPGTGLSATYYATRTLSGNSVSRIDPLVNFNWGNGSPDPAIPVNNFSARWTGQVKATHSETYTFFTRTDDGVRLWVDGQLLVDRWVDQGATERSGTISLTAGQRYDIVMEYYENAGGAVAELRWSSASTPKAFIPTANLYPSSSGSTGSGRQAVAESSTFEEEGTLEGFRIYPNPVVNELQINFTVESEQPVQIDLFSPQVKTIRHIEHRALKGENEVSMDVSDFATGLYFVRVKGSTFNTVKKVFVTR